MSDQAARARALEEITRHTPTITVAVVLAVAIPLGVVRGGPAVVLWLAFVALAGTVLLLWEALRTVLDPTAPGDALDLDDEGVPTELDARKRAALGALKDLDFEHSIGRISDDDHKALSAKYRAEARAAMKAIDDDLGTWLTRAEALLKHVESPDVSPTATTEASTNDDAPKALICKRCKALNDHDAVFCKKCGERIATEVHDVS